jgi:arylsulfatase A-like enzyme
VKTDVTVSLIDMYPTLAEMCQLPKPRQGLEGKSLAATLAEPASAQDRSVFLPHMNPDEYAIINRDWRYIRYGEDGEELYDVQADPNEWTNLALKPEYDGLKAEMRAHAPQVFAKPGTKLNLRKNLVIDGNTFSWEAP